MSEGTSEVAESGEASAAAKRKTLSMGERYKVIDYLRAQVEPIAADSNAAVAALVSGATGIEINWQQLKYMLDDPSLAEWKLSTKVYVKSMLSVEDQLQACYERDIAFEAKLNQLAAKLDDASTAIYKLTQVALTLKRSHEA